MYDILTDHDISHEPGVCNTYRTLISASHPEYVSFPMLRGYKEYLGNGNNFMFLGGTGYYWVTSRDPAPENSHRIEVRRGAVGVRSSELPAGERVRSLTGERGGLWRERGLPSNQLFGLGSAACGTGQGAPYHIDVTTKARGECRFLFEGLEQELTIGDFGLVNGAASGDEIDRMDFDLGTPSNAILIASTVRVDGKEEHSDEYGLFNEEQMFPITHTTGTQCSRDRSDLVLILNENGGVILATGSINWVSGDACIV